MPPRRHARSPLAIAIVTLVIAGAQLAWAATAPCGPAAAADRAAPCRCCPAPAGDDDREPPARDATIDGRCCAMDAGTPATSPRGPVVRTPPAPAAIAPPTIELASLGPVAAATGRLAPTVIARAVGPPLWLTTRSLRL